MNFNEIDRGYLILCANNALICEIRPNMRRISIEYLKEEKKIRLYFFYDATSSQEDSEYDVEETIISKMSAGFPGEMQWEKKSFLLPYPKLLPKIGICVYRRYEPPLPEDMVK